MYTIRRAVHRSIHICQQINDRFPRRHVSNNNLEALPTFGIGVIYPSIEGRVFYIVDVLNNRYVATVDIPPENHPLATGLHMYDDIVSLFAQAFVIAREGDSSFDGLNLKFSGNLLDSPLEFLAFYLPDNVVFINRCPFGGRRFWCPQATTFLVFMQNTSVSYTPITYEVTVDYSHLANLPGAMFDIVYYLDTLSVCHNFCLVVCGYLPIQIDFYFVPDKSKPNERAGLILWVGDFIRTYDYETFMKADDSVSFIGIDYPVYVRHDYVFVDRFSFSTQYTFGYKRMFISLVASNGEVIPVNAEDLC